MTQHDKAALQTALDAFYDADAGDSGLEPHARELHDMQRAITAYHAALEGQGESAGTPRRDIEWPVCYRYENNVVLDYEALAPDDKRRVPRRSIWTGGTLAEADRLVAGYNNAARLAELERERDAKAAEAERLRAALASAIRIADEAALEWDRAPAGMRAGKILLALAGKVPGYRQDTDEIHRALEQKQ